MSFTTNSAQERLGWFMQYSVVTAPACTGTTVINYLDMATPTATGWVSNDYSLQLSSGRANKTSAPAGVAATWLTGFRPNSNCSLELRVPPWSRVTVQPQYVGIQAELSKVYVTNTSDDRQVPVAGWGGPMTQTTPMLSATYTTDHTGG